MAPPKRERDLRNEVNTYMLMGAAGLSPSSAKWLLKQEGLNELLHFLARATPKTVRSLFDRVRKEALEDIEGPPKKTPQKRVAAEFGDASCAKKARLQGVQQLGKILSQNPENQVSSDENDLRKALEEDGEYDVVLNTAQQPFVGEKHDATLQKDEQESLFVAEEPVIEVDQQSLPEGCNVNPQGKIKGVSSVELGLTRGFQPVLVQVSEECCKLLPEHRDRLRRELETVFKACAKLSFLKVQYQLVQFLKNRYNAPAPKAQVIPHTWETDDPRIIFNNLQTLDMHSIETKIHRVYGRMRLHAVIQEKAARGDKSTLAELIQEIVSGAGNPASSEEMTRIVDKCSYEYYAGRRWLEVSLMFRGMGVVLVFIVAGIYVSQNWTEAQMRSLEHIAGHLASIRTLVQRLGPNSLKDFCENGFLPQETIAEVAQVEGPTQSEDADDGSDTEFESDSDVSL